MIFFTIHIKRNHDLNDKQVYETLKLDSRKGDFVYLIKQDMEDLDLDVTEEEIQICTKIQWKKSFMKE